MRVLAGREHSAAELVRKLTGKGIDPGEARAVVADLAERNLQSDERFTEAFVRSRVERGYGPLWIRQALQQKGVADALVAAHLDDPAAVWAERAERARYRRFGETAPLLRTEWTRQARFLAQRGFPTDIVVRVLGRQG
ncbi:MAG: regulatory protein RecX [Pseudomonadales bacterium]|nr:regulatory protein RecX [Pseudomonadales bacterium]